jgi:integrase/recombinase XerD
MHRSSVRSWTIVKKNAAIAFARGIRDSRRSRSLFRYAALRHPEHAAVVQRVLAIPQKRFERRILTYLTDPEVDALLAAPDQTTWTGRRDHTLLALAVQTGLRVSELIRLQRSDVYLGVGAHVSCIGKGRKHRITPVTTSVRGLLRKWLHESGGEPNNPIFATCTGRMLSRDALESRLRIHVFAAASACPTLRKKRVTLHVLRHTAAMRLLHAGVDTSVIALWLGHEQVETTQAYLHADLALKERALARTAPVHARPGRYRASDRLLAFLEAL